MGTRRPGDGRDSSGEATFPDPGTLWYTLCLLQKASRKDTLPLECRPHFRRAHLRNLQAVMKCHRDGQEERQVTLGLL